MSDTSRGYKSREAQAGSGAARQTYGNGVRKVIYRDPDGNELGFGGAPRD